MTTQEKVEELIKEGINRPLPMGITDASEIQKLFRNYTDALASTSEELICKIKDNSCLYVRPIHFNFIKRCTYATYRGIKIPTKGLYKQSKNKFIVKRVRKVLPRPIDIDVAQDPEDKGKFVIDLTFNTI